MQGAPAFYKFSCQYFTQMFENVETGGNVSLMKISSHNFLQYCECFSIYFLSSVDLQRIKSGNTSSTLQYLPPYAVII